MTKEEIRQTRLAAGLTQAEAAALINRNRIAWNRWESGKQRLDPALWELFCLKLKK